MTSDLGSASLVEAAIDDLVLIDCASYDVAGTSTMDDGLVPAAGQAAFYVTTGVNCAGESALGSDRAASLPCP